MIAVPALVYAVGAYGFFALPYTILVYPIVFVTFFNMAEFHRWITGKLRLTNRRSRVPA